MGATLVGVLPPPNTTGLQTSQEAGRKCLCVREGGPQEGSVSFMAFTSCCLPGPHVWLPAHPSVLFARGPWPW